MSTIKEAVRSRYGAIAEQSVSCCGGGAPQQTISKAVGYSEAEMGAVPEGANLGLGCGNPVALASLSPGQTVLDLGSGAGFDCFLAANKVGPTGKVIGVDMTDQMLDKARANAAKGGYANVEFRKGEIEHLPVADKAVDVIISNCVINLSTDKAQVFSEAFRVLKPGGKAFISDLVLLEPLPESVASSVGAYVGCVGGAMQKDEYLGLIRDAGFSEVKVVQESNYPLEAFSLEALEAGSPLFEEFRKIPAEDLRRAAKAVLSLKLELTKARQAGCC